MEQSQCEGLLHPGDPFVLLASELLKQEVQKLKEEVTVTTVVNTAPKSSLARGTASFQDANELLKQEVQKLKEEVKEMSERLPPGDPNLKPPRVGFLLNWGEKARRDMSQYPFIHYFQTLTCVVSAWSNGLPPQALDNSGSTREHV